MNRISLNITIEVVADSCPTSVKITCKEMNHEGYCRDIGISDYVAKLAEEWADMLVVDNGDEASITLETPED